MRSLALWPSLVLALALPFSLACRPGGTTDDEGTTYHVDGMLTESLCSPGLDPINPIAFDAEVRSTGSIVYWRLGRQPWTPGTIASDGTFRISTRQIVEAIPAYAGSDPDFDPPRPGCMLYQTETIAGRFSAPVVSDGGVSDASISDAGVDDAGVDASTHDAGPPRDAGPPDPSAMGVLTAENTIEISIVAGSDCAALLAVNGGAFPNLPCTATYALTGTSDAD